MKNNKKNRVVFFLLHPFVHPDIFIWDQSLRNSKHAHECRKVNPSEKYYKSVKKLAFSIMKILK